MSNENISCQNHKSFMRERFLIFTNSLFMSLSTKCTEPPKRLFCIYCMIYVNAGQRFKPQRRFKHTKIWLSLICLLENRLAERKMVCLGYSNFCMWEQRQRPCARFWIRRMTKREKEREKQTEKYNEALCPSKLLQRQSGWNKSRHRVTNKVMKASKFRKRWHISFICRENACLSKQRTI